jgi:hypothetical protein
MPYEVGVPNRSLIKERFEDAILKRTVKQRRRRAGKRGYHPTPIGVSRSPFTGLQALLFQPNFGLASQRLPIRWRLMERQSSVKTVIHGSCVRQKDGVPTASRCLEFGHFEKVRPGKIQDFSLGEFFAQSPGALAYISLVPLLG